jgi:putative transposase
VMGIARSTYYAVARGQALRRKSEAALRGAIENVLVDWPAYGYRRVTHEPRWRGIVVNHKRVARIMREEPLSLGEHDAYSPRPIPITPTLFMRTWRSGIGLAGPMSFGSEISPTFACVRGSSTSPD